VHVVLLRRVIGDALRARRQGQHRTLREVSMAANVSLGYLSEIERGQKEASSELLGAVCDALGAQLSDLLREVSDTVALAEQLPDVLVPAGERLAPAEGMPAEATPAEPEPAATTAAAAGAPAAAAAPAAAGAPAADRAAVAPAEPVPAHAVAAPALRTPASARPATPLRAVGPAKPVRTIATDGKVSVSIRQDSPLKATLRARPLRPADRDAVPVG
jgi:transcriptional regulator with XRE-family HTH domain